ncbi:MAG TPA: glycosyltransferase family 39 protein, partial [Candidatus Angelobacter sp.]|nr:glycosyltransferase family 39 protein [Candidatus Angelobacter sp.]
MLKRFLSVPAGFALATVLVHLTCLTQYGWFRDELYYMASTRHLAWGYVDHPPLSIGLLTIVHALFGESLAAARLVAALLGAATVFFTGRLTREAGGGAFAQALACLCALFAPVYLAIGHFYSMNAVEMALWPAASLLLLRALRTTRTSDWIFLGALLGLGLLNKISASWLLLGIGVGLVLTPHRRVLLTPGPWVAAAVAGLIFLPHVLWQMANHFPTLEFMRNATERKMEAVSPLEFLKDQLLVMGPGNALVWIAGLLFALFARRGEPWRIFAWIWLAVGALLIVNGKSRANYLSPAYPALFAAGGVAWERILAKGSIRWMRAGLVAIVAAMGLVGAPLALPILPVKSLLAYQTALGMAPKTEERQEVGPLSQHDADMFGWDELAAMVARARDRLTPEERRHARVFGQNYGEAGAVDVLGRRYGLPPAISGHNSYWMWGPEG